MLFAIAIVFYHGELGSWLRHPFVGVELLGACLALAAPGRRLGLAVLSFGVVASVAYELPELNTNRLLCGFVALALLQALAIGSFLPGKPSSSWQELALVPLRIELLLVYFWSGWAKLNRDFFDPEFSTAPVLWRDFVDDVQRGVGWELPTGGVPVAYAMIAGALLIELAGASLLLVPRARVAAVVLLVAFHLILGVVLFFGFSSTMIALLVLFLPAGWCERAAEWMAGLPRLSRSTLQVASAWPTYVLMMLGGFALALLGTGTHAAFRGLWMLLVLAVGLAAFPGLGRSLGIGAQPDVPVRYSLPMLLVPGLVFLNGLCPYIGLKTETSFAMYSNLRTEGGRTNHLILRQPWSWFGYLEDLVTLTGSSDAKLQAKAVQGHPIPWMELRLRVEDLRRKRQPSPSVSFQRNGRQVEIPDAFAAADFAEPPAWWQRKLLRFRVILPADANSFSH